MEEYFAEKYGESVQHPPIRVQPYQGIMSTLPSLVAFSLKIILLIIEALKFRFCYDFSEEFDRLKRTYLSADSSQLPQSLKITPMKPDLLGARQNHKDSDQKRRNRYNKLLKLKYVWIFRKS